MLLQSYSFDNSGVDINFYYQVWSEIEKLKFYFYKFAGKNADEAMQATFMHTLNHFDVSKGNLNTYVKSLARVITKKSTKELTVDFLEQTVTGDEELGDFSTSENTKSYLGNTSDFTNDVIYDLEKDELARKEIAKLSLEFMDKFILLCNALERHDTNTVYYPEIFIKTCMKINNKYNDFNQRCIDLYYEFAENFEWFLSIDKDNEGTVWKETDHLLINSNLSKRVKFINKKTNEEVVDADNEEFYLRGKITNKRIYKIPYFDVWDMMCDLVDSDTTNELKFIIDDYYIIKTFGGSYSIINPSLFNIYDLIRCEILTNLLKDTGGRLINLGSKCIYLLCDSNSKFEIDNSRVVRGYKIQFDCFDITDSLA